MKTSLGLDIGTNSVGWALTKIDEFGKDGSIIATNSRIIPVDSKRLQEFESGGLTSTKAGERTSFRSARKLKHRFKLRRTRLTQVLKLAGFIDETFPENFKKNKALSGTEFDINDYLKISDESLQEAVKLFKVSSSKELPRDWIVYYLRKKALTERITLSELARILFVLNQRRGFKSSRKDLEETEVVDYSVFRKHLEKGISKNEDGKKLETTFVEITRVTKVEKTSDEKDRNGKFTFSVSVESDKIEDWEEKRYTKPDWVGKEFRFLVTQKIKKNGEIDQNKPKVPEDKDWGLEMVALDNELENSGKTPGVYFFDKLTDNKTYKIRQQVVKREKYREELRQIWNAQLSLNPELAKLNRDGTLLKEIAQKLYPGQFAMQAGPKIKEITSNDLYHVIANDIIYYQRDLKSQKSQIAECRFEKKKYFDKTLNQEVEKGYKVAPRSCPEFQEFRIWKEIHNIRVTQKEREIDGSLFTDVDISEMVLNDAVKAKLFAYMDSVAEVKESQLLKKINREFSEDTHQINLFANRNSLKGNEIKSLLRKIFKKHGFDGEPILSDHTKLRAIWHILYSLNDKDAYKGIKSALSNPAHEFGFEGYPEMIEDFANLPEIPKQYAAYSTKAIKFLMPLMRCGEYWSADAIQPETKSRIEKFSTGEVDERIPDNAREKILDYFGAFGDDESLDETHFQGMPEWAACYAVYGRHSERISNFKYETWDQIDPVKMVPNNSLRNPIVEQVIRETLYIVKDIWRHYGQPDTINIELSRELKKNKDEREKIAEAQSKNFNEKLRIQGLLRELKFGNPESPADIKRFKLWKEAGGRIGDDKFNELFNNKNQLTATPKEIEKYQHWVNQNHKSPYTGKAIPLSDLFTGKYNLEHVIPQALLKDDSFNNLVIAESWVNNFKGSRLARNMIRDFGGQTITYQNETFTLLTEGEYETFCTKIFNKQRGKLKNLLATEVPEGFISRQLNDNRYITRKVAELLHPVAKEDDGIIFTTGSITHELKAKWGLNTVWKEILKPRFERLSEITGQQLVVQDKKSDDFHLINPEPDKEFDIKRIDHRHHALDALVISATTRAHIKYLNSLSSHKHREQYRYLANRGVRDFILPWPSFEADTKEKLKRIIVSHKVNNNVVSKPRNRYRKWDIANRKKIYVNQKDNPGWWAVRRSMFEQPQGLIYLKEVKDVALKKALDIQAEKQYGNKRRKKEKPKDYVYDQYIRQELRELLIRCNGDKKQAAKHLKNIKTPDGKPVDKAAVAIFNSCASKRVNLDESFNLTKILKIPYAERTIARWERKEKEGRLPNNSAEWPLSYLLKKHLFEYLNDKGKPVPRNAFTGEGMEALTKKNGNKQVKRVTIYEKVGLKFEKDGKLLQTDTGGNAYFVIYRDEKTGEHTEMYTMPLISRNDEKGKKLGAINRLTNGEPLADPVEGKSFFTLSPEELVWVTDSKNVHEPIPEDLQSNIDNIYKMVSCTDTECHFIPLTVAKRLVDKTELGANNKSERAWDGKVEFVNGKRTDTGTMIKRNCIKIEVDRLGRPVKIDGKNVNS